ncbi:hypothetical protein EDB89DRAFT_1997706 [Lactarius sanguifluus]|nr:hypothetical protein EDB89DRAFT_1997706 [Lactarius sanguifluus]
MVDRVLKFKPNLVITEKGILAKANVSALRWVRKWDNNRIMRAVGEAIVNRVEDLIGRRNPLWPAQYRDDR